MPTFDDRAKDWDTPEKVERGRRAAEAVARSAGVTSSDRVLDLGAGTGALGLALASIAREVTLADASGGMLAAATANIEAAGVRNVRVLRLELTVDPLPADRFDVITGLMSLHHVPDTAAALAALYELLAPAGRLAIVDLDSEDGSYHTDPEAPVRHGFDRAALGAMAAAAGFVDPVFQTVLRVTKNGREYPLFLLLARRA